MSFFCSPLSATLLQDLMPVFGKKKTNQKQSKTKDEMDVSISFLLRSCFHMQNIYLLMAIKGKKQFGGQF